MTPTNNNSKKDSGQLRTKKKERNRNTIIEEATRLFSEKSYDEVKLDEIAEAAFISRKTLYNYFRNKEDVFYAVSNQVYREENEIMAEIINNDLNGKEQIIFLCEKKFRDTKEKPILLKIIKEFWERFTLRGISAEQEYKRVSETIGASKLIELVEKQNLLEEFDFGAYFDESSYNELFVQFIKLNDMWMKPIRKGKKDGSIKVDLPDSQIMQYINILMDGVIREKNMRQSALDRIKMKNETIEKKTIDLVSFFLES